MKHFAPFTSSTLNTKLFWPLFIPVLVISLICCALMMVSRFSHLNQSFLDKVEHITDQVAATSEFTLIFSNKSMVSRQLQQALSYGDISNIQLYNNRHRIISELGQTPYITKPQLTATSHQEESREFIAITRPIYHVTAPLDATFSIQSDLLNSQNQTNLIGWVKVEANKSNLRIQKYQYISLLIFILIFFNAISAYIIWKTTLSLTQPIDRIAQALNKLVKGQFSAVKSTKLPTPYKMIQKDIFDLAEQFENHHDELIAGIEQSTEDIRRNMDSMEEKTAQLHIANKEAMESNRLKSQFLANISHEVRTPLNAILGYTKILQKNNLETQQQIYVDTIEQSTNSLLAIIGDILDFSKIEAGKLNLDKSELNLRELVDDVYQILSANLLTDDKQIDLVPEFEQNVPEWVVGDSIRVRQILTNLIGNALKFTTKGSVRTKVSLLSTNQKEIVVAFQIIDTGIGIPESKMGHLFKPFSQVDTSTTRQFGGTGLGLVITKKLVEQMDGEIDVTSNPGVGSTFHFTIHLAPSTKHIKSHAPLDKQVLLLEPSNTYKNYLTQHLKGIGVICTPCSDLEQMVVKLNQQYKNIDVILLNVSPNKQSIDETYEFVSYAQKQFDIPCILMMQPPGQIARYPELKAVCSEVLLKPVSHKRLYQALKASAPIQNINQGEEILPIPTKQNLSGLKILAVDDTPINLQLLGHWLKPNGLEVSLAYSGQQALNLVKNEQFDLILMDIQMPDMDGMETTRHIRDLPQYRETPIIALTAHALGSEQQQILSSGMNAYLTKPVDENILLSTIEKWCTGGENYQDQVNAQVETVFDLPKALDIVDGKVDIAKEMFNMLADSLASERKLIQHHFEQKDTEKLIHVVHRIHGASKYTGTVNITKHAGFLEVHLKELGLEEVEGVLDDFIYAIDELLHSRLLIPWPQ